jgi:hypothetical protein
MRFAFALLAALSVSAPAYGQYTLYACLASTKEYFVGAKLSPSGLFFKDTSGEWQHIGYNHPFLTGLAADPADPSVVYASAGNALIRISGHGTDWRFLTSSDVTELRDVVIDPHVPGTIYFAYVHGIRVSRDRGAHWEEIGGALHRKYTETLALDRQQRGVLLAGGEEGIFRSDDSGRSWKIAGAAGFQVSRIAQSPHDACSWLAVTQKGGIFASTDCGKTFENVGRVGVDRNLYDVAFDPSDPQRVAVAGWGPGVVVSDDGGKTWQPRNVGLPRPEVLAIAFDPGHPGRLYASVNEDGLYVSPDAGKSWTREGLAGSAINRLKFLPAVRP